MNPRILKVIRFMLLMFLIIGFDHLQGQSVSNAKISGRVTNASTGEPLPLVNVFLAGTTRGDATDKEGNYAIENIKPGTYELVASLVGYEMQKMTIRLVDSRDRSVDFSLKPKILEGEEVTVIAEEAKEWRKNLKIFERVFFGVKEFKPFAQKCKILNPEILDFTYDRVSGDFQAFASKPLHFVNEALGYEVTFLMGEFKAKLYNDDIFHVYTVDIDGGRRRGAGWQKGTLHCLGTMQYKERSSQNEIEKKNWEQNRRLSYNGSLRHFLKALCEGRLKQEGFQICGAKRFNKQFEYPVKADTLIRQGPEPFQRLLAFPNFLKVAYTKEKDEMEYQRRIWMLKNATISSEESLDEAMREITAECSQQISWLRITNGTSITITTGGVVAPNGASLGTAGYWGFDVASEWLPTDYEPRMVEND